MDTNLELFVLLISAIGLILFAINSWLSSKKVESKSRISKTLGREEHDR